MPPGGDVSCSMFHPLNRPSMKTKTLILAALSAVVLAGCKEYYYSDVPEEYRDYFPYKTGDSIVFVNGETEMDFRIGRVYITEDRTTNFALDPMTAHPKLSFSSQFDEAGNILSNQSWIKGEVIVGYPDADGAQFQVNLKVGGNAPEDIFLARTTDDTLPDSLILLNIETNNWNTTSFQQVIITKDIGITSLSETGSGELWTVKL